MEEEQNKRIELKLELARSLATQLLSAPKYDFSGLVPSMLENHLPVIYAIFDKNLRQRLYNNHLMGSVNNARLKKYLSEDLNRPDIPDMEAAKQYLIDHCYFQYIPEHVVRVRGQIEGLLSYLLDVRYIHEEH